MEYKGTNQEYLLVSELTNHDSAQLLQEISSSLAIVWFTKSGSAFVIDDREYAFEANQVICLTEFHKLEIKSLNQARVVKFNRPFYCIIDHDKEVGCKGILFFGASQLPLVKLETQDLQRFEALWQVFESEMDAKDNLQMEMLQMLLKRMLIMTTRLFKEQNSYAELQPNNLDIIREFNFLVEQHFRTKHTVAEYAELLNRSPKTLSNLFSKIGDKTPLQYIQERIMLDARRQLTYTDKPVKEIAYDIGYDDIQAFSRFFKKNEGLSPTEFREKPLVGKN